ncbi:MAG: hypothetical protein NWE89_07285 [Candidatus Bathyarchaeota archaeon]|nr:hypothetical protein [Candidatus Bathyarchaeota archaeon]
MVETMILLFGLLNGVSTYFPVFLLINTYQKTSRRFYLYWGTGYGLFGLSFIPLLLVQTLNIDIRWETFSVSLLITGFFIMYFGVSRLFKEKRIMVPLFMVFLLSVVSAIYYWKILSDISLFFILPSLLMTASIGTISLRWKIDLKLLITGWAFLFLNQLGYSLDFIDFAFASIIAIFSKILICWGMLQPGFSFLVEDIQIPSLSKTSRNNRYELKGGFTLVSLFNSQKERELQWIKDRVNNNARNGIRTILISLYDLISPSDIDEIILSKDFFLVRVLPGIRSSDTLFEKQIIQINDNISYIDLLISDIINFSNENKCSCEIIIYSFSHLIHTHGWRRVYSFLISKNPLIKSSYVNVTGFYYPESHEDASGIAIFEKLADQIISK